MKEFVKLNSNINTMVKNLKIGDLKANIVTVSFNAQTLKMIDRTQMFML